MDIKVGEYIRTKSGYFAKVKNIICKGYPIKSLERYIICDAEDGTILNPEELKHSFNLIDLIEVGDYVNGYRILNIVNLANSDKKVFTICKSDFKDICRVWGEEDIETILTHEQYNANCYKVKGE